MLQSEPGTSSVTISNVEHNEVTITLTNPSTSIIVEEKLLSAIEETLDQSVSLPPTPLADPQSSPASPDPEPEPRPSTSQTEPMEESEPEMLDEETLENIQKYRMQVRAQLQTKLQNAISNLEGKFHEVHLNLGKTVHLPLPWQHIDWNKLMQRMAQKSQLQKVEKNTNRKVKKMEEYRRKRKSDENGREDALKKERAEKIEDKEKVKARKDRSRSRKGEEEPRVYETTSRSP